MKSAFYIALILVAYLYVSDQDYKDAVAAAPKLKFVQVWAR